jgi:pimeloyl-ACP methyl ester carboxylesterase
MPYVTIDGRAYHYRDVGEGQPLLLLHGFPLTGASFWPQLDAPPKGVRLIVPDHRGFGQSARGDGPLSIEGFASDALALLDALVLPRAAVGGVSMGGYAAMALLRLDPARVAQLVLIDTQSGADDEAGKARREATALELEAKGLEPLVAAMMPKLLAAKAPDDVRRRVEAMMRSEDPKSAAAASRAMAQRADSREILFRFAGPALVVVGSEDPITPPAKAKELAGLIGGSRLVELEGAGHLSNLEKPLAFNAALGEFLAFSTTASR